MTFYENLRIIREDRGFTQKQIADVLETTRQYYSDYENDGPRAHMKRNEKWEKRYSYQSLHYTVQILWSFNRLSCRNGRTS